MKFSVVVFPGSNSDYDAFYAASRVIGADAELVWHKDTDLKGADAVILPGGFAHGDYLRTGAIARPRAQPSALSSRPTLASSPSAAVASAQATPQKQAEGA